MSRFSLSGKFGVKFGFETSPGLSSFRPVSQHTTVRSSDGSRQPSALEKDIAEAHGEHFGTIAAKLAK